jgi:hypothetical protein
MTAAHWRPFRHTLKQALIEQVPFGGKPFPPYRVEIIEPVEKRLAHRVLPQQ